MNASFTLSATEPWLAYLDVEDVGVDPDTDEGKEDCTAYAAMIHFANSAITHVIIRQRGSKIGEMLFLPKRLN
jgi:hypothetical protein